MIYSGYNLIYDKLSGIWVVCQPWLGKHYYFRTRANAVAWIKEDKQTKKG